MQDVRRRVLDGALWLTAEKAVKFITTLLGVSITAAYLGPAAFGSLMSAVAFALSFLILPALGLDQYWIRRMTLEGGDRRSLVEALGARSVGTALALLLYFPAAYLTFSRDSATRQCALVLGLSLLWAPLDAVDLMFQGRVLARQGARVRALVACLGLVLRFALVRSQAPLLWFALVPVMEATAQGLMLGTLGRVSLLEISKGLKHGPRCWREALRSGLPLVLAALCVIIYSKADQVIVLRLAGAAQAGLYSAALKLLDYVNTLPMILAVTMMPALVRREGAPQWFGPVALGAIALTVAAALLIALFPLAFTGFFYGTSYSGAAPVLRIAVFTAPLMCMSVLRHGYLVSRGSFRTVLAVEALSALCSLALNFWLMPLRGAEGGALALLGSALIVNGAMTIFSSEIRHYWSFLLYSQTRSNRP